MDRCWSCGDYIDENGENCLCDRQRKKLKELQYRLATAEAERGRLKDENERLRNALNKFAGWKCNGECKSTYGVTCACCIAKAALREVDSE